jgi:rhodanese-related sulfurtransferase
MQINSPSQRESSTSETERRRFLRQCLIDAREEFSRHESPHKIIEIALLTAMGALGVFCGFSGLHASEVSDGHIVGRGLDGSAMTRIAAHVQRRFGAWLKELETPSAPYQIDVRRLSETSGFDDLLNGKPVELLVWWRLPGHTAGFMGLGATIKDAPFLARETEFLHHLTGHMLEAIRAVSANAVIHMLENELEQARQQAAECSQRNDAVKKELEETLFRFAGLNDIFHELNEREDSKQVLEAFLLVVMGIFSVQSGLLLYWSAADRSAYAALRGFADGTGPPVGPAEVQSILAAFLESQAGVRLEAMQATVLPGEQLKASALAGYKIRTAILFRVDQTASGVLCLGSRLVDNQYGHKEKELLVTFTQTFLAFLKNSLSFETIKRLHHDQEQKNIELEKTVQALSESRRIIAGLEKAGERIKSAIAGAMARSTRASVIDVVLILMAGTILGLVYNFASPAGISVVPPVWRYPPPVRIDLDQARALMDSRPALLVDARPVEFYDQRHIHDALNLPSALFDFVYMMRFSRIDPRTPVVVYGRNISRLYDEEIAHQLTQRGHTNVFVLNGGLAAWQAKGWGVSP